MEHIITEQKEENMSTLRFYNFMAEMSAATWALSDSNSLSSASIEARENLLTQLTIWFILERIEVIKVQISS